MKDARFSQVIKAIRTVGVREAIEQTKVRASARAFVCESSSFVQALSLVRTGQYASVLPSTGAVRLSPDQFSFKNVPLLKDHKRKIVLHWNERQVTTRDISAGQIKAMSRALSVK